MAQQSATKSNAESTDLPGNATWDDVGFIVSSQYRVMTMAALADYPQTPSQIANENDVDNPHISRALSTLSDEGYVELLVSDDRKKGRLYGLTETGKAVAAGVPGDN